MTPFYILMFEYISVKSQGWTLEEGMKKLFGSRSVERQTCWSKICELLNSLCRIYQCYRWSPLICIQVFLPSTLILSSECTHSCLLCFLGNMTFILLIFMVCIFVYICWCFVCQKVFIVLTSLHNHQGYTTLIFDCLILLLFFFLLFFLIDA